MKAPQAISKSKRDNPTEKECSPRRKLFARQLKKTLQIRKSQNRKVRRQKNISKK